MAARGPNRERDFEPGQALPGTKYRVVRKLGVGGMGVVYQVEKPPQIQCVLKLMSRELSSQREFRAKFLDEVRVLAQLEHPHIVRVFDYDTLANGTPFYVMELLHGRTLRDVLAAKRSLPPRVAFEITRQLLEALHCAHTHDVPVVHRDIKPENIFLHSPKHADPVVKLIDFGVVAIADRAHDGTFVGTWKYAAPEQIRGERATAATDLYSVGLVLYEMLAGLGPFDHIESGPAVSEAHLHDAPLPVSQFAPWVPKSVVALLESALAKDPQKRPRDAYAFAERLFELEWADAGSASRADLATSEGPLSRVLSTVQGAPAAGGAKSSPTSTSDDDALLAGLLARDHARAPSAPASSAPAAPWRPRTTETASDAFAALQCAPSPPGAPPKEPDTTKRSPNDKRRSGLALAGGLALSAAGILAIVAMTRGDARSRQPPHAAVDSAGEPERTPRLPSVPLPVSPAVPPSVDVPATGAATPPPTAAPRSSPRGRSEPAPKPAPSQDPTFLRNL